MYARKRLEQQQQRGPTEVDDNKGSSSKPYFADAANPASWPVELKESILAKPRSSNNNNAAPADDAEEEDEEVWILALDCLYHFRPSRKPIFSFAHNHSQTPASIMAFDLVISPTTSPSQNLLLFLLAWLLNVPPGNFITVAKYKEQLVHAGYSEEKITVEDVSQRVFGGLATYIEEREGQWRMFTGQGIGAYGGFKRVLRWWERSGVVRGVVVVARR